MSGSPENAPCNREVYNSDDAEEHGEESKTLQSE